MSESRLTSLLYNGKNDKLRILLNILCKQSEGVRVCHLNAQSLSKTKLDEFRRLFVGSSVDVICVSETWFNPDVRDEVYSLHGYKLFRGDRHDRVGGGVAIYIRKSLAPKLIYNSVAGS